MNVARQAACDGKVAYPDHALAMEVAIRMRRRRKRRLNIYRCRWCRCWHIGTNRPRFKDDKGETDDLYSE